MANSKTAIVKAGKTPVILFGEISEFSSDEANEIRARLSKRPETVALMQKQNEESVLLNMHIANTDKAIRDAMKRLRETPEFAELEKLKRTRRAFVARRDELLKHAEGAFLTIVEGLRHGAKLSNLLAAFSKTFHRAE